MIDADIKNDILNECMSALGQPPLSTPDNPQGYIEQWAVNRLKNAIDEVLELRPWAGAFDEAILSQLARPSLSGSGRYPLPQDCVRVNFVRGLTTNDWRIVGRNLVLGVSCRNSPSYSNTENLSGSTAIGPHICYNHRVPRIGWSANLRTLMGLKLAIKVQRPNEKSTAAKRELKSEYFNQLRTASAVQGATQSGYVWREDLV